MKTESPKDFVESLLKANAVFADSLKDEDMEKISAETESLLRPLVLPLREWSVQKVIDHAVRMADKRATLVMAALKGVTLTDEQKVALMKHWKTHALIVFTNSMFQCPWNRFRNITGLLIVAALYAVINFFHPISLMAIFVMLFAYEGCTDLLETYAYWRLRQVTGVIHPFFANIKHSLAGGVAELALAAMNLVFVLKDW